MVLHLCSSVKILGVFPIHARSHYILGSKLMKELSNRGHEVTMLTTFEEKNINFKQVDINFKNRPSVSK